MNLAEVQVEHFFRLLAAAQANGGNDMSVLVLTADPTVTPTPGQLGQFGTFGGLLYLHLTSLSDTSWLSIQGLTDLATSTAKGLESPLEHIVASVGLPTVLTFQFAAKSAYAANDSWVEPGQGFSNGLTGRFTTYRVDGTAPLGTTVFDIRTATTAQDVALVAAAVINGDSASLFTAGVPVAGLLTLTAKVIGPQTNAPIGGTGAGTTTIVQYGRLPISAPSPIVQVAQPGIVWAAFGDSITRGNGVPAGSDYVSVALRQLGVPTRAAYNFSISGTAVQTMAGYQPFTAQVGEVQNYRLTNLVTMMVGVNDYISTLGTLGDVDVVMAKSVGALSGSASFAEAFRLALETVIAAVPRARIAVMLPLPTQAPAGIAGLVLQDYRNVMERICLAKSQVANVEVWKPHEDLGIQSSDTTLFQVDGVHLTTLGQMVLGQYVARSVVQVHARGGLTGKPEHWELIARVAPTATVSSVDIPVVVSRYKRLRFRVKSWGIAGGAQSCFLRVDGASTSGCNSYGMDVGALVSYPNNVAYLANSWSATPLGFTATLEPDTATLWRSFSTWMRGSLSSFFTAPTTSIGLGGSVANCFVGGSTVVELYGVPT